MAFVASNLALLNQQIGGKHRTYEYRTTDSLATVLGASYITSCARKGVIAGDTVIVIKTDDTPPIPYRLNVGTVSSDAATLTQNSVTTLQGFYGATPIVQRAGAAQATSLVGTASSTAVNTDMKAALIEVMNTLSVLGLWKGAA